MRKCWIAVMTILCVAVAVQRADALTITGRVALSGASNISDSATLTMESADMTPSTVVLSVTDTDFAGPLGSVFAQFIADVDVLTGSASALLRGYVDTTNTQFGTEILIGTADLSTVPFIGPFVPVTLAAPYALTLIAEFTLQPGASLTFEHSLSVVPSPTSVPEPPNAVFWLSVLVLSGVMGMRSWRWVVARVHERS